MKRLGISILLVASLVVGALPTASAAITPGSKCSKSGIKQTYKGKIYTCIKLGSKLYWNNGVKVPVSTPSPKVLNEILGAFLRQDDLGNLFQSVLVKEIKTGRVAIAGDAKNWTTSFKTTFDAKDIYEDYILGCPKSADCTQSTYITRLNQTAASMIDFGGITHPGNFAAIFLKEADFGLNQNSVIAHLKFSARYDGASDLIVRYDVPTKIITPIFVTYCNSLGTGAGCSSGASINGLRVSRETGTVYFILNQGILYINNIKATQSLVSLPLNAPAQKIGLPADATLRSWDGDIQKRIIYTHQDLSTTIDDIDFSATEDEIFLITRGKKDVGLNNGICTITIRTGAVECSSLEPFDFISNVIPVGFDAILYENFSGMVYYNIKSKASSLVYNTFRIWPLDLSN
jgi:hypothetical protein